MAWSGECSEYEEGDDGDDTGSDIDDLPDEELIVVLRDEQNSIKEAQRLIHKEIKSVRRELKRLLRLYAATNPDEPCTDTHGPNGDVSVDSGLGEVNYATGYNTASEVASFHGDGEAGYQAFIGYEIGESAGHLAGDGRYRRQSSGVDESGAECGETVQLTNPYSDHEVLGVGSEHHGKSENGERIGYGLPPHWEDDETNSALEDHTRGRNSTYEDAYTMLRRRHNQIDMPVMNKPKSSGSRWKSIIHSSSETDQQPKLQKDHDLPPERHGSVQSSEDELGNLNLQDFSDHSYNYRKYSSPGMQTRKTDDHNHKVNRTESAHQLIIEKKMNVQTGAKSRPTMPVLNQTQSSQFLRKSRNGVPHERPSSVASDGSDQNLPLRQVDGYSRLQSLSSEDDSRHSSRYSDSSFDSSPGLSRRRDYSTHVQQHPIAMTSPKGLKRTQSSTLGTPSKAINAGSRDPYTLTRNSLSTIDTFQDVATLDENWNRESIPKTKSDFSSHSKKESCMDTYIDHADPNYSGQKRPQGNIPKTKQRAKFLSNIGRSSSRPEMTVRGLVSSHSSVP